MGKCNECPNKKELVDQLAAALQENKELVEVLANQRDRLVSYEGGASPSKKKRGPIRGTPMSEAPSFPLEVEALRADTNTRVEPAVEADRYVSPSMTLRQHLALMDEQREWTGSPVEHAVEAVEDNSDLLTEGAVPSALNS